MDSTSQAIERSFRELVESEPYRSITVSDICENAHLSRKSFYAHFENKEAIVSHIFINDVIRPVRDINSLFSVDQIRDMHGLVYGKIYEAMYENSSFYKKLVKPMRGCDDTFIRVATNAIYGLNYDILDSQNFAGDERKRDYISYFFAASQAMLIQKWICDDMPYSPAQLADFYREMTHTFWLTTF